MPFQYAKVNGTYDEALGVKVNWVSFDTGTAMSQRWLLAMFSCRSARAFRPSLSQLRLVRTSRCLTLLCLFGQRQLRCEIRLEIDKMTRWLNWPARKLPCRWVPLLTTASCSQMNHFGVDLATSTLWTWLRLKAPRHWPRVG